MRSRSRGTARVPRTLLLAAAVAVLLGAVSGSAQDELPALAAPVNDFARVVDAASAARMDGVIRALQQATGDVVTVVTVDTVAPYADIDDYATKLFENRGRGIGQKAHDNGLLIVLAVRDRRVRIEVGYGLEPYVTDGFAGETIRQYMAPAFRAGNFGAGLQAGVERIVGRIAEARHVELDGVRAVPRPRRSGSWVPLVFFAGFLLLAIILGGLGGPGPGGPARRWGRRGWSGWTSGVGPFGGFGGFGGGFGGFGGGGGGGFGGFGGGRSGGGGASGGW